MVETIMHNNCILAIIIRGEYRSEGIQFFTPEDFSQQLAYINRPAGYKILPHFHNELQRKVIYTHEVLFVRKGKVKVDFYDENQNYVESRFLRTGDVILLASGGHGFEMLDRTEMIEVKQGPYSGDKDKVRFEPKN